jgi:hypothetical protein
MWMACPSIDYLPKTKRPRYSCQGSGCKIIFDCRSKSSASSLCPVLWG